MQDESKNKDELTDATIGKVAENLYTIRAFKAIDDREASIKFVDGHHKVLLDYGIENLNTTQPNWIDDPNVYVVMAFDHNLEVVGGLRVHKYVGINDLPLIDALEELDPKIIDLFERSLPQGTAEVCGLWNSKKIFGKGISPVLCMCSVTVVTKIGLSSFYCFSAPHTEKMIKTNGCIVVNEIGNEGRFNYPTSEFISVVLFNPDVIALEFADPYNVERIRSLMAQPNQSSYEKSPRGPITVKFELL